MLRKIDLFPLGGLFDELYNPCLFDLQLTPICKTSELYRLNGLFWGQLFSDSQISEVIYALQQKYASASSCDIKEAAILSCPDKFRLRVHSAVQQIIDQSTPEPLFGSAIETISMLCRLYSEFKFAPYNLTVSDGFLLSECSSLDIVNQCLENQTNPWLPFLEKECFPVLLEARADVAWIHGPIRMSTLAMAIKLLENNPHIHISVIGHSSEYYSLSKITRFLRKNEVLFKYIDSIVLDDNLHTKGQLEYAIEQGDSLAEIPNIIYYDRQKKSIVETQTAPVVATSFLENLEFRRSSQLVEQGRIDPSSIVCGKLFPNRSCPWHKCTFCGINQKYYANANPDERIDDIVAEIQRLITTGVHYFWFYDEAVLPERLREFAQALIDSNTHIVWHVRARIDAAFTSDLCVLLHRSGLREIRFGLESASCEIQKQIHKFDRFDLSLVERLVKNFCEAGIGIHFPVIVGMPNETALQREETYSFLRKMRKLYPLFSFNVNILEIDTASLLYQDFEEHGITGVKLPCSPKYCLSNSLEAWADQNGWFDKEPLSEEQNQIMREQLYTWMAPTYITPANIFYRLSETIRNTLIWKAKTSQADTENINSSMEIDFSQDILRLSDWVVFIDPGIKLANELKVSLGDQSAPLTAVYDFQYNNERQLNEPAQFLMQQFLIPTRVCEAVQTTLVEFSLPDIMARDLNEFVKASLKIGYLCH